MEDEKCLAVKNNIIPTATFQNNQLYNKNQETELKLYKRRWVNLILFILTEAVNTAQWVEYSIIANVTMKYYGISAQMVDNTALIYLIVYMPLVIPASYLMDKKGMKYTVVLAALGNCLGSWLKVPSAMNPDLFYLGFLGQTVLGCVQLLVISTPPRFAAIWFGPDQVGLACSLGVFGQQLGAGLGFVLPPLLVRDSDNLEEIGNDFFNMFMGMSVVSTVILIATFFFCEAEPPSPPSRAQYLIRNSNAIFSTKEFLKGFKRLMKNGPFLLILLTYGINLGVFITIGTLLNQMILTHFAGAQVFAGQIGLIMIAAGIFGSILFGYVLDKTHKYKQTSIATCVLSVLSMAAYSFALSSESKFLIVMADIALGVFTSGYIIVAYEYAAELTYPEPETGPAGLMNSVAQMLGVVFVIFAGFMLQNYGDFYSNMSLTGVLVIGTVATFFVGGKLKRLAQDQNNNPTVNKYELAKTTEEKC